MEILSIKDNVIDKENLKSYLAKLASDNIVVSKSEPSTYPIPRVKENLEYISLIAELLRQNIKIDVPLHPAGEWLLDNFYIIEKSAKTVCKELTKKKYVSLPGLEKSGFSRIYVIANEIISNTDGNIDANSLKEYLESYQTQKKLIMEEIWNVNLFLQISLIEKIRNVCERIFISQMEKMKAQNIIDRVIENNKSKIKIPQSGMIYPFIEYMSYKLKSYGKEGFPYLEALEEQVNKKGLTISEIIEKEHFDIAIRKMSMMNAINSLRNISKMNMSIIFKEISVVEQILSDDPAKVYPKMDYTSKVDYRNKILEISKKTKISEFYVANEALKLCQREYNQVNEKKEHIGYYLIGDGYSDLISHLTNKKAKRVNNEGKSKVYVTSIYIFSIILTAILFKCMGLFAIILYIPIQNVVTKFIQYLISKIVKPRHIPKIELANGLSKENATMCIIPTVLNSVDDVKDIIKKMEVYYLANKSENLYFTLLGDCKSSNKKEEDLDKSIIKEGVDGTKLLNQKYGEKFFFTYRKREWTECERCFMGWERKRGMIIEFNDFLLNGVDKFKVNTCKTKEIPYIKYVITIDSDTVLIMDSVFELVGAMSHILNKPEVDKMKNRVINGHAIIQPRVVTSFENRRKSLFTRVFAGNMGLDLYSSAAFDVYQDLFDEGIYTGKGIYDLGVFQSILKDSIPENKVLSHDLIEGSYLRCALANDIFVVDGYPGSYEAYKLRKHRWIRGDVQILGWLKSNLDFLSKYKIIDNIVRNLNEFFIFIALIVGMITFSASKIIMPIVLLAIPLIIDLLDLCINKRSGEAKNKLMSPNFSRIQSAFFKAIMDLILLPDMANLELNATVKALYRMNISHKKLLEWTTANEAEKSSKRTLTKYYSTMKFAVIIGICSLIYPLGILWIFSPLIMFLMSKKEDECKKDISNENKKYLLEIAQKTWNYFKDNMTNYLISDNYQEDRREKVVNRTSPTNIGFEILSIIASYDLGFENKEQTIDLIEKVIDVVYKLPKWNGHLYNWYDIEKLEQVMPFEISSVDSANFVCYLYVLKQFLLNELSINNTKKTKLKNILTKTEEMIKNADFSKLYDYNNELFSVGFNVEENKLLESNYDLLASEARQISLVAIAKKDVPSRHWNSLGRTLTTVNNYKGLMSWGGTAFEYLMPNIIIPTYESSILDESCKVLVMSQKEYARKFGIPWGISESSYSLKDFYGNYQYRTFGVPWLGLKRGLENYEVISPYSTVLALSVDTKGVISNLKRLEKEGAVGKYGFYEAIDYIPEKQIIKSYMAHHQGMILTSIDNKLQRNIFQKRFMQNPEFQGIKILLQEKVPENIIINDEKDISIPNIKYERYNDIQVRNTGLNVISTRNFSIIDYQDGNEITKMNDNILTDENNIYIKDLDNNKIYDLKSIECKPEFTMYDSKYVVDDKNLKITVRTTIAPDIEVGIREIKIKNKSPQKINIECITLGKPVLSSMTAYEQHPSFSNMFLQFKEKDGKIIVSRKKRNLDERPPYLGITLFSKDGNMEYEINKEKVIKRGDFLGKESLKDSVSFSSKIDKVINPIVAMKTKIEIEPGDKQKIYLVTSSSYDESNAFDALSEYMNLEKLERVFELSRIQTEAEARYMNIGKDEIQAFQKMLRFILQPEGVLEANKRRKLNQVNLQNELFNFDASNSKLWEFGISGDYPIVVVKIKEENDLYVVNSMIKAYEYFASKHIRIELVIITKFNIDNKILDTESLNYIGKKAGIFVLNNITREKQRPIEARASLVIDSHKGSLIKQMKELDDALETNEKLLKADYKIKNDKVESNETNEILAKENPPIKVENLMFYNGYGGFSKDGIEYWIKQTKERRIPTAWSNILVNDKFGSVITDAMRRIYMVCK